MKMLAVVLFFFFFAGICNGEICNCMSYVISENGLSKENLISSINYVVEDIACDGNGVMKCKTFCTEMYETLTDNGKVCVKYPGVDKRVADWMCESLKRDISNGRVAVFSQGCGSDPIDTGFRFTETISCKSGFSVQC